MSEVKCSLEIVPEFIFRMKYLCAYRASGSKKGLFPKPLEECLRHGWKSMSINARKNFWIPTGKNIREKGLIKVKNRRILKNIRITVHFF